MSKTIPAYPIGYRGFAFNGARNADGTQKLDQDLPDGYAIVDRFDFSRLQQRDQREALHVLSGGDLGVATNVFRYVSIVGQVKGKTAAGLEDTIAALLEALDVENAQREHPGLEGIQNLSFSTPTALAGYTPLVAEIFKCRPAAYPAIYDRRSGGLTAMYAVELVCADYRRYIDPAELWSAYSVGSWSVVLPNWGTTPLAGPGVATFPVVTVDTNAGGAYSAALTIDIGNGIPFVLNLSAIAPGNHLITIDMFRQSILLDGVRNDDLRSSNVLSFFPIPRGGATAVVTNHANIDTVDFAYRQARA